MFVSLTEHELTLNNTLQYLFIFVNAINKSTVVHWSLFYNALTLLINTTFDFNSRL